MTNEWIETEFTNATHGTEITKGTTEELLHRWYVLGYEKCKKEYEQKINDLILELINRLSKEQA